MTGIVVDASVGVKWCLPAIDEQLVPQAVGLLQAFRQGAIRFFVPDLFWVELANVLWKAVRRRRLSLKNAEFAFSQMRELGIPTLPSAPFLSEALRLAASYDLTVYDGVYVVLAVQSGVELVTADERLANALAAYLPVKWLGAF
ncbi:MAG: type II toxin-antitoxin system VapC family toxin [Candidatus Sulfotelmatobacter sp.]